TSLADFVLPLGRADLLPGRSGIETAFCLFVAPNGPAPAPRRESMAGKQGSMRLALPSPVFGSIPAPVVVNLANKELNRCADGAGAGANVARPSQCVRVVTRGRGRTPEEALRD